MARQPDVVKFSPRQIGAIPGAAGYVCGEMPPPSRTASTTPSWRAFDRDPNQSRPWCIRTMAVACLVGVGALLARGFVVPAAGVIAAVTTLCIAGEWRLPVRRRLPPAPLTAPDRPQPGDPDLYLDLDAVEIAAVYLLGVELFAHLRGGIGERRDPLTGDRRPIQTSDVSLTWRCVGHRSASRLAEQLNEWEARRTPLRLLAARGRCALLIENDHNWVVLPELRLGA
jgi:hypothetical protein